MNIKTKFNVGNSVFCVTPVRNIFQPQKKNCLDRGEYLITGINAFHVVNPEDKTEMMTSVHYTVSPKLYPSFGSFSVDEQFVFPSFQEARTWYATSPVIEENNSDEMEQ